MTNNEYINSVIGYFNPIAIKDYPANKKELAKNYYVSNNDKLEIDVDKLVQNLDKNTNYNTMKNKNIIYLVTEGGEGDLESFNKAFNNIPTNLQRINVLVKAFDVLNFYKINDRTNSNHGKVCFVHNDIKPPNIIYRKLADNDYGLQVIDFGGIINTPYFFNKWSVSPPLLSTIVYGNVKPKRNTPLFDIGCIILSLISSIFYPTRKWYNGWEINNDSNNYDETNAKTMLKNTFDKFFNAIKRKQPLAGNETDIVYLKQKLKLVGLATSFYNFMVAHRVHYKNNPELYTERSRNKLKFKNFEIFAWKFTDKMHKFFGVDLDLLHQIMDFCFMHGDLIGKSMDLQEYLVKERFLTDLVPNIPLIPAPGPNEYKPEVAAQVDNELTKAVPN
jgi:serine/threonine protein kinase